MRRLVLLLLPATVLLLTACFGGGNGISTAMPTPSPATTATPPPRPTATPAPPTPSPSPSPVVLPELPARLTEYPDVIARFLSDANAPLACPNDLLDAWQVPIPPAQRCAQADTDADGAIELVLVLTPPQPPSDAPGAALGLPVLVTVLDQQAGEWKVAYRTEDVMEGGGLPTSTVEGGPDKVLMAVRDLNGLPGAEIAFRLDTCGAHTCSTAVEIVGWDGARYADMTAEEISISFADVALEDRDRDGTVEVVMHGGSIGSVGAGPTRTRTDMYRWDGRAWSLAETVNDPSNFLYHAILDADEAFRAGDYAAALELYRSALANTGLDEWKDNERAEMEPYALFRTALGYFALGGSTAEADAQLSRAIDGYPDSPHGRMAAAFRDAWLADGSVSDGCEAALAFITENADDFAWFWDFGYGNPPFDAQALCPL